MNNRLQSVALSLAGWMPDAFMAAGAGLLSYGVWRIYEPAGFMTAGALSILVGWLAARGNH